MKNVCFVLLSAALLLIACGKNAEQEAFDALPDYPYPNVYTSLGLPVYPESKQILDFSDRDPQLKDGVVLKIVTFDEKETINDFWAKELKAQGWGRRIIRVGSKVEPADNTANNSTYAKDRMNCAIAISERTDGLSEMRVTVSEADY